MHGFNSVQECQRRLPEFADFFELSAVDGAVLPLEQWPMSRILGGELLHNVEICIRHTKVGWQRVFGYGGALVRDAEGQPLLAVLTINDITAEIRPGPAQRRALQTRAPYSQDASGCAGSSECAN